MFKLTLEPFETPLNNLTLYEPVDITILDKILNSDLLIKTDEWNEEQQLTKYKEIIKDGKAKVKYIKSKNNLYGRSNPEGNLGLHTIRREIRHTLTKDKFIDIDIENCHPVILYQICKDNNIKCTKLYEYITNRNKYLSSVMDHYKTNRDTAKKLFICLLYGGGLENWKKDNKLIVESDLDFIVDFKEEFKNISEIIKNNNPELTNTIIKIKQEKGQENYNLNGSVCSYFLQEYEIRILTQIYIYCQENNYIQNDIAVLCADGLMLEKKLINTSTILTEFNELIKNTIGFDLIFTIKEMDQDFKDIDSHIKINFLKFNTFFTTGQLAEYFKIIYSDRFIVNNKQLYFYNGVYWEKNQTDAYIHNFIDSEFRTYLFNQYVEQHKNLNISLLNADDKHSIEKQLQYLEKTVRIGIINLGDVVNREKLVKDIKFKITNDNNIFDNDPYLLAFKNKIYDLKSNTFIKPNPKQFISKTTGYDYNIYYNKKLINELDNIINTILPIKEVKDFYLTLLSTGIYGEQLEYFIIATGKGGNGKSLLNTLMSKTVGEYGYTLPSTVLLNPIKEGGNPQVYNMNKSRFVITQEPEDQKGNRFCASTIKEITGNKNLNVRQNHSNECGIKLSNTLFLECNNLPQIDEVGDAINRRLIVVPFISKFVSKEDYEMYDDKTNLFIGNSYYKTDDFLNKYKQALFEILRTYFIKFKDNNYTLPNTPKECKEKAKDYLATSDNIFDWFSTIYEPTTDNDNEPIIINILHDEFKNSELYSNLSKADKRKYTLKYLNERIQTNIFLSKFYKPRDTTYNKKKYKTPYIIGFKRIETDDY